MSRGRRAAEATGFVAVWMALGWALRLDANGYLLLGVPLATAFQRLARRAPLRAAWIREGPPFRLSPRLALLAVALAAFPLYRLAALPDPSWARVAWHLCSVAGAPVAAYALCAFRAETARALAFCMATAVPVGVALMVLFRAADGSLVPLSADAPLRAAGWLLLYFPVAFIVEEVVFRGVLDAHLHHPGERHPLLSAILVSALWGLWHLPLFPAADALSLVARGLVLILAHVLIGVPLSLGWRRGGNLAVPALAHALVNAVRNVIAG